jgi:hypothetical protein
MEFCGTGILPSDPACLLFLLNGIDIVLTSQRQKSFAAVNEELETQDVDRALPQV